MAKLYTTLNKIRDFSPCASGWAKLLKHLGKTVSDDEPLPFSVILESNGLYDALWCTRTAPEYDKEWRLFAVWCARQMQHLNQDVRVVAAIDAAEAYINGHIDKESMATAGDVAVAVARTSAWAAALASAAAGASAAAMDAAGAAAAAMDAAGAAAGARDAPGAASGAAAWDLAWDVAWDLAWDVASDVAKNAQAKYFLFVVDGGLVNKQTGVI